MAIRYGESNKRILFKSLTFRILILTADGIVVFLISGQLQLALKVMLIRNVIAMVIYYMHEEYWNKVQWGYEKRKIK